MGTIGMVLYILAIYTAGITQGLMWRAFDASGSLQYPDFVETVTVLIPMYWIRMDRRRALPRRRPLIGGWNVLQDMDQPPEEV